MLGLWILDGIHGLKALALVEIFHGGEEEDLGFLSRATLHNYDSVENDCREESWPAAMLQWKRLQSILFLNKV